MTMINALFPVTQTGQPKLATQHLLDSLLQAGSFHATVLQQKGSQVLLETRFGRFTGQTDQALQPGGEVKLRVEGKGEQQRLHIIEVRNPLIKLKNPRLGHMFDARETSVLVARVVQQTGTKTLLSVGSQTVSVDRLPSLQIGDRVMIRPEEHPSQVTLEKISPRETLRRALYSLLARSQHQALDYDTPSLQRFTRELGQQDLKSLVERANLKADQLAAPSRQNQSPVAAQTPAPATAKTVATAYTALDKAVPSALPQAPSSTAIGTDSEHQVKTLLRLLGQIQQAIPRLTQSLQPQWTSSLHQLLTGQSSSESGDTPELKQTLTRLLTLIKQEPDAMRQFVQRELLTQSTTVARPAQNDAAIAEWSNLLRLELLQQGENSLNQLLTQQTTGRLQVEQNQPLQIQFNLPIVIDQTMHPLKISIRQQRSQNEDEYTEGWDIQLTFELGLLGLITTRIMLRDQKLSANFWAESSATRDLIETNLGRFRQQLLRRGFDPGELSATRGHPPEPEEAEPQGLPDNLLDIEA